MPQAAPSSIEKLGDHEMKIVWDDGHVSLYRNPDLRFACACAACVDEWSGVRRLRREEVAADVRPNGIQLVGNYALHFDWSDGHTTGIYSWDVLRALCPCPTCAGRGRL